MANTFYFYDLETTGLNSRNDRIMQFAGQRTDMNLKLLGEPDNYLIKLSQDVLPQPDAILVTGITPQKTLENGITEAEFLKIFEKDISDDDTIFVGYNNVRFDDEFMRFLRYRNYYDAYDWQWENSKSRWDLLDVVRMTRALRPEGIKWPFSSDGKPSNQLGLLTKINKIEHSGAHDALADVQATISLASLIKENQPKLFTYLLNMRNKKNVAELVQKGEPFVYSSGKYDSNWEKTTVVVKLADHPERGVLLYDLRTSPEHFENMTPSDIVSAWTLKKDDPGIRLPVKTLLYNRCPAIAPLSVLNDDSIKRLELNLIDINQNYIKLKSSNLNKLVLDAVKILDQKRKLKLFDDDEFEPDTKLYDKFISSSDKVIMKKIVKLGDTDLSKYTPMFSDERLNSIFPLYKARNFSAVLSVEEIASWDRYLNKKLFTSGLLQNYSQRIETLLQNNYLTKLDKFLLEELKLYGQSILPN